MDNRIKNNKKCIRNKKNPKYWNGSSVDENVKLVKNNTETIDALNKYSCAVLQKRLNDAVMPNDDEIFSFHIPLLSEDIKQ